MDSVAVAQPNAQESLIIYDRQVCRVFANCCHHNGLKNESNHEALHDEATILTLEASSNSDVWNCSLCRECPIT